MQQPTLGRIVIFRSRTGNYSVPAVVVGTSRDLNPQGVALYEESGGQRGVPPLTDDEHIHLVCLTPGLPGMRKDAQDFLVEPSTGLRSENVAGTYQEWDVPFDGDEGPGTWAWPERR